MKKMLWTFLVLLAIFGCIFFVSCRETNLSSENGVTLGDNADTSASSEHVHTFSEEWNYDNLYHWHSATCGHNYVKSDYGKHSMQITDSVDATETTEGHETYTCSVCGKTDTAIIPPIHVHTYEWLSDEDYHWQSSTCGHFIYPQKNEHTYDDNGQCICGRVLYELTELNDGNYAIIGYNGKQGDITIPLSIGEKRITAIADNAFKGCNKLLTVIIPRGITHIGNSAFQDCANLRLVAIPEKITHIGDSTFQGCDSLYTVKLPNSLVSIGIGAFRACRNLTDIKLPDNIETIGGYAFYGCRSIDTIELPPKTKTIGEYAFCDCNLKEVRMTNVETIEQYAFLRCILLENVSFGNSLKYIGKAAFKTCMKLQKVEIDYDVTLGDELFSGCYALKTVSIGNGIIPYSQMFYECYALEKITLSQDTKWIGSHAFCYCRSLQNVEFPETVISIGQQAFYDCDSITVVNLSHLVQQYMYDSTRPGWKQEIPFRIYGAAFAGCDNLKRVVLPTDYKNKKIDDYAFSGCPKLESIENM